MTTIELIVYMDCGGCEIKIKKALQKLDGVDNVEVDMNMQKVTVTGWADQHHIMKAIKKTGMKAELWPYTPENHHNGVVQDYYYSHQDQSHTFGHVTAFESPVLPSTVSYNYITTHQHNYDDYDHERDYMGRYYGQPYSTLVDEKASVLFSDENPHACYLM